MKNITNRIKVIAQSVRHRTLADIGTDHGYIPIYAHKIGMIDKAIACDMSKNALSVAQKNIKLYGLDKSIMARLGDGLDPVKAGEVKSVSIAGIGGDLTIKILDNGKHALEGVDQLILAPQTRVDAVRRYVHKTGFRIVDEVFIKEDERYYNILNCEKGEELSYTYDEYFLGKILLSKKDEVYLEYLEIVKAKMVDLLEEIEDRDSLKAQELHKKISAIQAIID